MKLAAFTAVFAVIPALVSATCKPNFQGAPVKILNPNSGDYVSTTNSNVGSAVFGSKTLISKWLVPFDGQPANNQLIKLFQSPGDGVLIAEGPSRVPVLQGIAGTGNPVYNIQCNTCLAPGNPTPAGTVIGSGCTIADPHDGALLTLKTNNGLFFTAGSNGNLNQQWKFIAV